MSFDRLLMVGIEFWEASTAGNKQVKGYVDVLHQFLAYSPNVLPGT
jgi:hypothetical protein